MTDLISAELEWRDKHIPVSKKFNDIYFSLGNGLEESRFVFLGGIGGTDAWKDKSSFVIAETGFGTGLNFLATWQAWRKTSTPHQRLQFISIEGYPLQRAQLAQAHSSWQELDIFSKALLDVYPEVAPGFHHLQFDDGRVSLLLLFGEAKEILPQFHGKVDAWYLDGFSPKKNPELWNEELYKLVASTARPGTRLATFTAAGHVRRGLAETGFAMEKVKGFAHKRERLIGIFPESATTAETKSPTPWFSLPKHDSLSKTVAVIGGGIAGNTLAYHMAQAGIEVTLFDRQAELAQGASGNPAAIFEPKLMRPGTLLGQYLSSAYLYASRFYRALEQESGERLWHHQCGALNLVPDEKELLRRQSFEPQNELPEKYFSLVTAAEASKLAGIEITKPALWYPEAGCLDTVTLARALTANVTVRLGTEVIGLKQGGSGPEGKWFLQLAGHSRDLEFDVVVLANAFEVRKFSCAQELQIYMNRGQVTVTPAAKFSPDIRCIVSGSGYITPLIEGKHVLGASFERLETFAEAEDRRIVPERHEQNLALISEMIPGFAAEVAVGELQGRTSVRATTMDRFPFVGPLPVYEDYLKFYAGLKNGAAGRDWPEPVYYPNLYVSAGYGSRGFVTAPMMADYLTGLICRGTSPIPETFMTAVHPGRFTIRELKRDQIKDQ
ncbi:bifunctional tRNA (5-methylaminomethyl-2-thiouridine)(34)-methyltransferase MnmD/FAD-dependent 5-carboxymethylaminomethyl-2-thiouridine(34) oxidoreductase MnmC [Kiloniella laminariae]|uniref:tRNA 5-methylaminomethyl-2-thiouridine biosynthesis bifunctional protein MnmC n=1 Tax=Kiloniella laminariae TaxID=454162 RepID=A0ABT4LNK9_9PROT|nr:bifunctional tRNA (5-methylaminomethyl-2-thiouridine)(34)-methyltransferase MnmD/FAD-dependent 5-carboxymethylaminomethyl-2-thiouridine(34) oxidoreductase MnmC [Kiloniella laminariae]MCZ4281911.1 bifunctional tRNA (5-methylaminomethyl-2-thiouridine)(34)-methyltransferase MnmD/FAD-dependent 5-carboxymethylaminomethyl-2-thiouridine(34) oxidoreductase MnmC [Kiloniella laminariae]